jgi:hypothetical protein
MPHFENKPTGNNPKESTGYLEQISKNTYEKIGRLIDAAMHNQLPRNAEGRITVLELGTGGGESLALLKSTLGSRDDVDVIASDVSIGLLKKIKNEQKDVMLTVADAINPPFKENSLSAVNVSAVFHEVSSYGPFTNRQEKETLRGLEAVKCSLIGLHKALLPGGLLAYRDIFCPQDAFTEQTQVYKSKSWKYFLDWFLPDFLNANIKSFPNDSRAPLQKNINSFLELIASKHVHREVQRHYLMFRDYLRTQLASSIGLGLMREEWVDKDSGIKTHEFFVTGTLLNLVKELGLDKGSNFISLDSKEYDTLFDVLIERIFQSSTDKEINLDTELYDWKKREGTEIYTYTDIEGLLMVAGGVSKIVGDGYILFPRTKEDMAIIPRNYYNRYLEEVVNAPIFDGKQIISFHKMPVQEAVGNVDALKGGVISDISNVKAMLDTLDK